MIKTARSSDSREYTVGASCVNALSSEFNLYVRCGGKEYEIDFSKGRTTKHLYEISGHFSDEVKTGTEVSFVLDKEVWGNEWFNFSEIKNRLHELTYLNPGLTVVLDIDSHDLEGNPVKINETFIQTGGLQDYIADKTKQKNIVAAPFILSTVEPYTVQIHPSKTVKGKVVTDYDKTVDESREMTIDISAVNTDSFSSDLISFVNNVRTEYGGDHETGFKMGIFNAIKKYLISKKLIKNEKDVESDDCREGMIAIVSVKLTDPNFEGQGKGKIRMNIVRQSVKKAVEQAYTDYLNEDDNRAQAIMEKVLQAIKAKEAARRARNIARGINNIKNSIQAVDKFADCSSKDPDIAECFLVEGDSAAGSAKMGRDRHFQAILPVFGKILNAEKASTEQVLKSVKIKDLVKVLGCGIGDQFDLDKLRYHRIIVMSDADSDGGHIQCLHMTNLFRYMRPIVEAGYLYAACPPLYKVSKKKGKKEEVHYLYTQEELENYDTEGCSVQRYKG